MNQITQEQLQTTSQNFKNFIGQKKLIKTLKIMINSAKIRQHSLDHILFFGKPGLGKTTLAKIIADDLDVKIHYSQGSLITKKADILALFGGIKAGDIVFIDEIHSIHHSVEELLYSAMEYFVIDLPVGIEGDTRIMRMKLNPFTLIGATTKINQISMPLKDRFGFIGKMNLYTLKELKNIIKQYAKKSSILIEDLAIEAIAKNSKNTPRICLNLVKRSRDFAIYESKKRVDLEVVENMFKNLGIHNLGLSNLQIEYLLCLFVTFKKSWASLDAIASIVNENRDSVIHNIEADLLQLQLIEKSSRGRRISQQGIVYIKKYKPKPTTVFGLGAN